MRPESDIYSSAPWRFAAGLFLVDGESGRRPFGLLAENNRSKRETAMTSWSMIRQIPICQGDHHV
jgi:hypothetical protein